MATLVTRSELQSPPAELAVERGPLRSILETLVRTVESQSTTGLLGSILLLDQDGVHLRHAAAPSLPAAYSQLIDGVAIGPAAGSCGTAAYTRETVLSEDIEHDPRWAGWAEIALTHDLRACWSTPIVSRHGHVLGTFAAYNRAIGAPTDHEQELIRLVATTAALVIERDWEARERAVAETALERQVAALTDLHTLVSRLAQMHELQPKLLAILTVAAQVHDTDLGFVAVHDAVTGTHDVRASLQLPSPSLEALCDITTHDVASVRRIVIADTETDSSVYRMIAREVGFRAVHSTPIMTRSGALLGVLALQARKPGVPTPLQIQLSDMCARHAADAIEAERDRAQLRELADNMSQLAWIYDQRGLTWFNKQWHEYTGMTVEEATDGGWVALLHPDHITRVLANWHVARRDGAVWEDTFPMRARDGTYRWFLSRALPIRDATGRVVRWFGTSTDITVAQQSALALADARDQAEAANQAKDRFLASLSHELRLPLSPILMCATALEIAPEIPESLRGRVATIRRNVELETKLIDDLLDVSRIRAGTLSLDLHPVGIATAIAEAVELCRPLIEAKALALTVEPNGESVVRADSPRLRQILWNVLKNAAKFTPRGGSITIRSRVTDDRVVVTMTDSGIGITRDALAHVFDAFEQADPHITQQF
nr:GAF domain-containing protein [Deltaproteobacteria bacterium]